MAGRQDGTPISKAAAQLGLSAEATRKRLQRGTLNGYKDDDGGWFVLLGEPGGASGRQDTGRTDRQDDGRTPRPAVRTSPEEPIEATYHVTPVEIEQAIERTGQKYVTDMAALYDRISAEVGKLYEGQLAAKDETIVTQRAALVTKDQALAADALALAELRRRAEQAEAERDKLVAAQAAPAALGATGGPTPDNPSPEASVGFWGRVRRVFVGE